MKILLVEDDLVSARVASQILEHLGHEVHGVTTAIEGLAAARERDFEVALVDVQLPDFDGFWVVSRLSLEQPDLKCILVTAHAVPDGVRKAREMGADFLNKPVDYEQLDREYLRPPR